MTTKSCRVLLCLILVLLMPGVQADPPAVPTPTAPAPLSLAGALNAMPDASVADGSVVLTVQPFRVMPLPAAPAPVPPDGGTPGEMLPAPLETAETVQTPEALAGERRQGAVFDPWTDPKQVNQIASLDSMSHPYKGITPASVLCLPYNPYARTDPGFFAWRSQSRGVAGDDGKRAGGEVFDLATGVASGNLLDTLDKLNVFLKK